MKGTAEDPAGVIGEAYRIDGITEAECRSIFLDWVLGLPAEQDVKEAARRLLTRHATASADHPMTRILEAALDTDPPAVRRGGRAARGAHRSS